MVSLISSGRLGNLLFQTAACIGYALRHDLEFHIPHKSAALLTAGHLSHLHNPKYDPGEEEVLLKEYGFQYQSIPFMKEWGKKNIVLSGQWQSLKYFDHCLSQIRTLFGFPWNPRPGVISLHKRLGDYRDLPLHHPVISDSYIYSALLYFSHKGYKKFKVFSDDIAECRAKLNSTLYSSLEFEYSEGKSAWEDLHLMSECEGHIISNSTFSWWAAVLNQNPDKIVVTPHEDNWFGPYYKYVNVSTLLPEEWVRIRTDNPL